MLKIRVSRPYEELKDFVQKLSDACEVCVVFEHETDETISRTHIHAYVEGPQVSTDTMKNWVKKALKVTTFPKTDWSFTEARDRGFITYLTKGKLDPLFYKGVSQDDISSLKDAWVLLEAMPKKKTQYILKQENPAQQKMRQTEMVDEIRRRINTYKGEEPEGKYDPFRVVDIIKDVVIIQNKTVCGRYKFRDYYDTVMAQESPFFKNQMINFCAYRS